MTDQYIGFALLETFLDAAPSGEPVYLMLLRINRPETPLSAGLYTYRIMASQIQANGRIHYWMRDVAAASHYGGDITSEHEDRPATADSAISVVREYLTLRKISTVNASLAMPEGIRLLEGAANCLDFDPKTKRFLLRSQPAPPVPAALRSLTA